MRRCGCKLVSEFRCLNRLVQSIDNFCAGSFSELLGNLDEAMIAYEHALSANPNSIPAMNAISLILRTREDFHKAVEYLQAILKIDANNGEVWGSLGMSGLNAL